MNVVKSRQYYIDQLRPRTSALDAYLTLVPDGAKAVEELERCEDVTLDQKACKDCCGRPPAGADWHLVEPLLERNLAEPSISTACTKHSSHGELVRLLTVSLLRQQ